MLKISHAAVSVHDITVCLLFSRNLGCSFIHSVVWAVQLPVCFQCIAQSLILFWFISFYFTFDYTPNPPPFILFYIFLLFIFFRFFPRTPTAPYILTKKKCASGPASPVTPETQAHKILCKLFWTQRKGTKHFARPTCVRLSECRILCLLHNWKTVRSYRS